RLGSQVLTELQVRVHHEVRRVVVVRLDLERRPVRGDRLFPHPDHRVDVGGHVPGVRRGRRDARADRRDPDPPVGEQRGVVASGSVSRVAWCGVSASIQSRSRWVRAPAARAFSRAAQAAAASFGAGGAASELPSAVTASPQYAIAQLGSCWTMASKTLRDSTNQYECSMATPRSNWADTAAPQEIGNVTLP